METANDDDGNGMYFQDIWLRVYSDSLARVDPLTAARRANMAVAELPGEVKTEIMGRHMKWINMPMEAT